eukprot:8797438-Pyramimonas_sp.AAC.1
MAFLSPFSPRHLGQTRMALLHPLCGLLLAAPAGNWGAQVARRLYRVSHLRARLPVLVHLSA